MLSSLGEVKGRNYFQIFPFSFFFLYPFYPNHLTMQSFRIAWMIWGFLPSLAISPAPSHFHSLVTLCTYTERSLSSNSTHFIFALDLTRTSLPLPSWQLGSRRTSPVTSKRRKLDNLPTYWRLPNPKRCFSSLKVCSRTLQIQGISLLPSHKHRHWIQFWNHRHQPGSGSWPRFQKWSATVLSFPSTNNYTVIVWHLMGLRGDVHVQSTVVPEAGYRPRIPDS